MCSPRCPCLPQSCTRGHTGAVSCLHLAEDGVTLLTGSDDGTARLWYVDPEPAVREVLLHTAHGGSDLLAANHDLAASGGDGGSSSSSSSSGSVLPGAMLYGHEAPITCCAVSTHLDIAVTGAADGAVLMHSVRLAEYKQLVHERSVRVVAATVPAMVVCVY